MKPVSKADADHHIEAIRIETMIDVARDALIIEYRFFDVNPTNIPAIIASKRLNNHSNLITGVIIIGGDRIAQKGINSKDIANI